MVFISVSIAGSQRFDDLGICGRDGGWDFYQAARVAQNGNADWLLLA
ncbi:hypothetical protein LJR007_000011 [Aminobacter sp. LjRoot7]